MNNNQADKLVPFAITKDASELLLAYVYKQNCTVSQAIRDKFTEGNGLVPPAPQAKNSDANKPVGTKGEQG